MWRRRDAWWIGPRGDFPEASGYAVKLDSFDPATARAGGGGRCGGGLEGGGAAGALSSLLPAADWPAGAVPWYAWDGGGWKVDYSLAVLDRVPSSCHAAADDCEVSSEDEDDDQDQDDDDDDDVDDEEEQRVTLLINWWQHPIGSGRMTVPPAAVPSSSKSKSMEESPGDDATLKPVSAEAGARPRSCASRTHWQTLVPLPASQ